MILVMIYAREISMKAVVEDNVGHVINSDMDKYKWGIRVSVET